MEQKLKELENILKMILKAPKINKSNISLQPISAPNKIIEEDNIPIIQENIENNKILQEMKMKILEFSVLKTISIF